MIDLKRDLLNLGNVCRSAPFWSWNDELSSDELVRQVKDMKEHGRGGILHAFKRRDGNRIPERGVYERYQGCY